MTRLAVDERVIELARMRKERLLAEFVRVCGHPLWSAHPIERWSRDDLIADILRTESHAS